MANRFTILYKVFITAFLAFTAAGCSDPWLDDMPAAGGTGTVDRPSERPPVNRVEEEERRRVLILYSAGYNNLKGYLQDDINELKEGLVPSARRSDDVILVYSHASATASDYITKTTPHLIRIYTTPDGTVAADTLITYPEDTRSSSAAQLKRVLMDIRMNFSAESYGMVFSSHASGYLPPGFYAKPSSYKFQDDGVQLLSVGADYEKLSSGLAMHEMDLREFADAIPMKMDYILFDACLMGGVEVAFELRDKCDRVGFSQAEVLAEGLDYKKLTTHLFRREGSDPESVCVDFFEQYDLKSGLERSASISLVNTEHLDELAGACAHLFERYRYAIRQLETSDVQDFGGTREYFFDLVDIIRCAGATESELAGLQTIMDKIVAYKSTTGQYFSVTDNGLHKIEQSRFSGLTMYMPRRVESELDKYYRTLDWNMATELVEY